MKLESSHLARIHIVLVTEEDYKEELSLDEIDDTRWFSEHIL